MVSEVMLQQTQVERVIAKYADFIRQFPTPAALARAPVNGVLAAWQGLGYNRRALSLKACALEIVSRHAGAVPRCHAKLMALPGIGPATATAICVFAFNQPLVLIETNIRTVYIHHFFQAARNVRDADLAPLIEQTLDRRNPRQWYNALMDYGTLLKKLHGNPGRKSAHYARQATFRGSDREIRGLIIKVLVEQTSCTEKKLLGILSKDPERVRDIIGRLEKEGFVRRAARCVRLA